MENAPSRRARLLVALAIGVAFSCLTWYSLAQRPSYMQGGDFTYSWFAARALIQGENPYLAVRSAPMPSASAFFYPLPTAIVAMPFAGLSARMAGVVFVGLSCGLLAFAVTRRAWWPLAMFGSAPACQVFWSVQWSPLMMTAALLWPVLGLLVCKPNLALPLIAYQSNWRALWIGALGALALLVVSLGLQQDWLSHWQTTLRENTAAGQYRIPILTPWGAVLGLAALKWRRPEARLLLALSCIPQTGFFYDQFPLLLIPGTLRQMLVAALISQAALFLPWVVPVNASNVTEMSARLLPIVIAGLYIPAFVMVIRRPNEGSVPRWMERLAARLPSWLRGRPSLMPAA
jgi:hypothetical protein